MLLTVSTTHRPATDLGYLLHKHPDRLQAFSVPFGKAHVFYPEATDARCTAALLLEIDPVGLVRRSGGRSSFALAEYVNDRPYVASSFLSVLRTDRRLVDVTSEESQAEAAAWWEQLTASGGEGAVMKPLPFVARGRKGLVQPGIKCRGREYLRIIYGPEYADPSQIDRVRGRGLGRKRSLAVREFGLGVEALERFVRREPLYRVHECVFGVLALESEPVDPRL